MKFPHSIAAALISLLISITIFCQNSVSDFDTDGYKIHNESIVITNDRSAAKADINKNAASVTIDSISITGVGISGLTISIDATLAAQPQGGTIRRIEFSNVKLNGVGLRISDHQTKFKLRPGQPITLPAPIIARISGLGIAKTAFSELVERPKKWHVSGSAMVYGKFKRFGIGFKRAVPVKVDVEIDNPLF